MAKARARSPESEEEPVAKSRPKKAQDASDTGEGGSDDEASGEEVEYEIEEILDAKKGAFPEGKMGYWVRWKGYGPEEDSWVNEDDAGNADSLVQDYWAKQKKNKKAEVSPQQSKSRKSNAAETSISTKKRGRKSTTAASSDADVEMEELRSIKKSKKSAAKARDTATPFDVDEGFGDMSKYRDIPNWDDLITSIDTIEREEDSTLYVYCRLNNGERIKEKSDELRKHCPDKLITFYEANLRWKAASDHDD